MPLDSQAPAGALVVEGVLVGRPFVGRLVDPGDDERRAARLQVVAPEASSRAGTERVLVVAARVLLEEQEVARRLDVVRLMDQVDRPEPAAPRASPSIRTDRLCTLVSSRRSKTILKMRPFGKGPMVPEGHA